MGRDTYYRQCLSATHAQIQKSRVLVVGAGGIGCELLKNLVLTGFGTIHIVDLDTIDLSNLNRQFLFRHEHIKKPKALVAKETATKFNPHVTIEAYHANIKDAQFNDDFFKDFEIVFNALDNMDARRHVNQMCIKSDVPLVESGTTGYIGQASIIKKGITECYECYPKEKPRTYPVCTIRSTPSQPIHCIVWAKSYLFSEIFGEGGEEAPELDNTATGENREEIERLRDEALALKKIRGAMCTAEFAQMVFNKVFTQDIQQVLRNEDTWKNRRAPVPLQWADLNEQNLEGATIAQHDQRTWTVQESFAVFVDSLSRLRKRMLDLDTASKEKALSFDKDDEDTLDFVAAAANLRSYIYGIEMRSKFDMKQMAGNIIPAIATTNAIIAGACVLQAFKIFRREYHKGGMLMTCQSMDRLMASEGGLQRRPPNPLCPICSVARSNVAIDPSRATLADFVDTLRTDLGYGDDMAMYSKEGMIYEVDEDMEENLPKLLSELGIKDDSVLEVVENPRVTLVLKVEERSLPAEGKPVQLPEKVSIPEKKTVNGVAADATPVEARKRALEDGPAHEPNSKKRRTEDGDVVLIEDTDGAIVLD